MSNQKTEKGLRALYAEDPLAADQQLFGRTAHKDRRGFLKGAGLATMTAVLGMVMPFHRNFPAGLIPAALAEETEAFFLAAKDGLTILNDRPVNAETPAHLLDDDVTPTARHFVRNNGLLPDTALRMSAPDWTLTIDGEVETPLTLTIDDLKKRFEVVTLNLCIECGGNGRAAFDPPARGNQWTLGAVANSAWTGVRLVDVLNAAGVKDTAVYTAHYSTDHHLSRNPEKQAISRGIPIAKAMDPSILIAFEMNGEPIPALHGFPLRLVTPGWPGSTSQKWLQRIEIRDQVHDGAKMTGKSYRVPAHPVSPGTDVPKEDFKIIEAMPVKSLITHPETGAEAEAANEDVEIRGHAWAGDRTISTVHISIDFGATWTETALSDAPNPGSWQSWRTDVTFPQEGYYEVWARATDSEGVGQPFAIDWNPKGYLNNSLHRIALTVRA
jgi:DMSO/TMAO reductase YedYZ molybdopterin-dependent catalytic subunit